MNTTTEVKTVHIILTSSMAVEEWEMNPPVHVPAHALLRKIIEEINARPTDEDGNAIPYRLRWEEGDRYLLEAETLEEAGVKDGHHLVLAYEARAGGTKTLDNVLTLTWER